MLKEKDHPPQEKNSSHNHKLKKRIIIAGAAAILLGGLAWAKFSGSNASEEAEAVFTVQRGDLRISILEAGRVQAKRSATLRCEMDDETTIISIVPEGTYAKEGDVLVELDASEHTDEIDKHQIVVDSAKATLTSAEEAVEIQKNQNDSDVKAAELTRDFALIDLKKYTGESAYAKATEAYEKAKEQAGSDAEVAGLAPHFAALNPEEHYRDGDWHQQLLKAGNDIKKAETSLQLAKTRLEGTERLYRKGYVAQTDLESDQAQYDSREISLQQAEEAKKLLIDYDHPKQLAKFIADYEESEKELGRVRRKAASKRAQQEAVRDAERDKYRIEVERLDRHKKEVERSVIKAPQPGLVIYASSIGSQHRHRRGGRIAEGEMVYERQTLIALPDLSALKVDMNLNESVRDLVQEKQVAIITIEALPGVTLRGHVEKVAILPDSGENWMNPDLTSYPATVLIDEQSERLTPGMTAKVEIVVAELKDVLYVPLQALTMRRDREVCIVVNRDEKKEAPVEVGSSNNHYVEIKSGLSKGDKVLVNPPVTLAKAGSLKKLETIEFDEEWPPPTAPAADTPEGEEEEPEKPPADMEERAKAFLKNLTPEQKKQMEERLKQLGIEGEITPEKLRELMPRRGGPRPAGGRPAGAPGGRSGPGLRRQPRQGRPSPARTSVE